MKIEFLKQFLLVAAILTISLVKGQNSYYIYDDNFVHGLPSGKMGIKSGSGLQIDPASNQNPLKGSTCLKIKADSSESWSGVYIQSTGNWKNDQVKGADLTPYKYLVVNIRSNRNYKLAKLGMGEDSEGSITEKGVELTPNWKRFVFELSGKKENINGLLLVVFEGAGEVYLDEVFYADASFKPEPTDIVYAAPVPPLSPDAYYVYSDQFDHGIPNGFNGEKNGLSIKPSFESRENPFYGNKCMKLEVLPIETWRGFHVFFSGQWEPSETQRDKCPDLSAYDTFVFYARSDKNHTIIREIGFGEISTDNSEGAISEVFINLSPEWKKYEININSLDRSRVNRLFFLTPDIGTYYFDEIKFIKSGEKAH